MFHDSWRDELLERTWQALAVEQPTGCAVLRLRVEEPELKSNQMAERLTVSLGRPQTAEGVRKALQRAHERFADLLLGEVESTLERPTVAELEAELQELGLTRYCRSALEAACQQVVRRRRLGKGQPHAEVERELEGATKVNTLASLALFDDATRGGDVLPRLNKIGGWAGDAFVAVKDGAHAGYAGDMRHLVENIERLCEEIIDLK